MMQSSSTPASDLMAVTFDHLPGADTPNWSANALPKTVRAEIADADWDELFHAVQARLKTCVCEKNTHTLMPHPREGLHDASNQVQTVVLECISALEQLHTALVHAREQSAKP